MPKIDGFGRPKLIEVPQRPVGIAILASSENEEIRTRSTKLESLFQWPGKPLPSRPKLEPLGARQQKLFEIGRIVFARTCAECHNLDGSGLENKAPQLVGSKWVLGPEGRLIRIVLHGIRGPITAADGQMFNLDMPALNALTDEQIASILTYIRRSWGHDAPAVDPTTVHSIRSASKARRESWTEQELLGIIQ